jgi:mRNA-degrading endonuclease RelE of RelBE toxin-antitoxin system
MPEKQTHKWLLQITKKGQGDVDELPPKDGLAVFNSIRELLIAENPYAVQGVKKLLDKKFQNSRRQEQGDWRIFFTIIPGEIKHLKHQYKGKLILIAIMRRTESTYN